jgi:hypothetical protein
MTKKENRKIENFKRSLKPFPGEISTRLELPGQSIHGGIIYGRNFPQEKISLGKTPNIAIGPIFRLGHQHYSFFFSSSLTVEREDTY